MGRITAIEPQKKVGRRRFNVFLDGRFAFGLSEDLAARLSPGGFLSEEQIADLVREDALLQVYHAALSLLEYRPRSLAELRSRLLRRSFDPVLVEEALERLRARGMVDDREFARFWVESRGSYRPRGTRMLQAELRAKGVEPDAIRDALPALDEEEASAYRAASKKARSLHAADWTEFRRRIGDHLVRRGFSYEVASIVARRVWEEIAGGEAGESGEAE